MRKLAFLTLILLPLDCFSANTFGIYKYFNASLYKSISPNQKLHYTHLQTPISIYNTWGLQYTHTSEKNWVYSLNFNFNNPADALKGDPLMPKSISTVSGLFTTLALENSIGKKTKGKQFWQIGLRTQLNFQPLGGYINRTDSAFVWYGGDTLKMTASFYFKQKINFAPTFSYHFETTLKTNENVSIFIEPKLLIPIGWISNSGYDYYIRGQFQEHWDYRLIGDILNINVGIAFKLKEKSKPVE